MRILRRHIVLILLVGIFAHGGDISVAPMHAATLHPKDTAFFSRAGNVIQGIAGWQGYWITSQHHKNRLLIFNVLDRWGRSVYAQRIAYASHGQDLGIKPIDDHHLLLVTRGEREGTVGVFVMTYGSSVAQTLSIQPLSTIKLPIGKHNTTPSLSTDGKVLVLYADNTVYLFDTKTLSSSSTPPKKIGQFPLYGAQRKSNQWFQGIAMHKERIYCLTGDNSLKHKKLLYIYDKRGNILRRYRLSIGQNYAKQHGVKWEMEGLAFRGDDLYTVVISGFNGLNTKHLYRILRTN